MNTTSTLVSIVVPTFNQGHLIGKTLQSLIQQTYKNIEIIVVDGGSSDNTVEVVRGFGKSISKFISEPDRGQSHAINKGFKIAEGAIIGWLNSDDLAYPHLVELTVDAFLENPTCSITYTPTFDIIDIDSNVVETRTTLIPNLHHLLNHCSDVVQPGSFYRKRFVDSIGGIDESIKYCMDLDLWVKLLAFGPLIPISSEAQSAFRIWSDTKTSTGGVEFISQIRSVSLKNGGRLLSKNQLSLVYRQVKLQIKRILRKP